MALRPSLNVLSLCSGVGGLDLGISLATGGRSRVVCYVEREAFAASVLVARMEDGSLDQAPVWSDLGSFDARPWSAVVDVVAAGFPCQPWSDAGRRRGTADDRWLWPHIVRVVRDTRPRLVFLENVPGLLRGGIGHVLGDLADLGFDAEWGLFSAAEVGAPHRRKRLFLLADSGGSRLLDAPSGAADRANGTPAAGPGDAMAHAPGAELEKRRGGRDPERETASGSGPAVADPQDAHGRSRSEVAEGGSRLGRGGSRGKRESVADAARGRARAAGPAGVGAFPPGPGDRGAWERILALRPELAPAVESPLRRVADGPSDQLDEDLGAQEQRPKMAPITNRMDRLRALGNAVVPATAALAWTELTRRLAE